MRHLRGTFSALLFLIAGVVCSSAQITYTVGWQPSGIAVGYLNSDGNPDIAVANYLDSTISVLLGDSSGNFTVAGTYPTGENPGNSAHPSIAVADFNSDGKNDVIVQTSVGIQILFGDGAGKLGTPQTVYSGSSYAASARFAIGDLRQSGTIDLVVGTYDGVDVVMGNGDGSFASPVHYVITANPPVGGQFTLADVNGDGYPDILAFNNATPSYPAVSLYVLLNDGKGNFGTPVANPWYVNNGGCVIGSNAFVGDFNGDGKMDIIGLAETGGLCLGLGNGQGGFARPQSLPSSLPTASIVTDYNGDGTLDIIGGNYIALGTGLPGFAGAMTLNSPSTFYYVVAADLNHDGKPDLVGYTATNNQIAVFINNYNGKTVPTNISAQAVPNAVNLNQPVALSASVTSIAGAPNVGSVQFLAGATDLGSAPVSKGVATESVSFPAAGTYQITANYSGATDPASNTMFTANAASAINLVVNSPPATTTTISASPLSANLGAPVTLQAAVSAGSTMANTGTVEFLDGAVNLGSAAVNSQGLATLTVASLATGSHAITAAFNGGGAYQPSSSSPVSVGILAPDFSVSVFGPASATVAAGGPATFTLTVSPTGGFNSAVSFSCLGLPAGAACTFIPPTVAPNGGNATATLVVSTSSTTAALNSHMHGRRTLSAANALKSLADGAVFVIVLLSAGRKHKGAKLFTCIFLLTAAMQIVSCGGGAPHDSGSSGAPAGTTTSGGSSTGGSGSNTGTQGNSATGATTTPAGTSQLTVAATAGNVSHSIMLSLTVTQ